jgi:LysM repeat protein
MQWRYRVMLLVLSLGLTLSACEPTSSSDPPASGQSQATAVIPVTPISGTYVVVADVAVARTGPSLDAGVLASFTAGDVVQVNGLSGADTWYRVVTDNGEGWIVVAFLSEQPTAAAVPATPKPTATKSNQEPAPTATLSATRCAPPTGWVQYVVQSGDTLSKLAAATGTAVADLQQANCLAPADNMIYAGLPLWLPRLPPPTAPPPDTPTATKQLIPTATATDVLPTFQPPRRDRPTETPRPAP